MESRPTYEWARAPQYTTIHRSSQLDDPRNVTSSQFRRQVTSYVGKVSKGNTYNLITRPGEECYSYNLNLSVLRIVRQEDGQPNSEQENPSSQLEDMAYMSGSD